MAFKSARALGVLAFAGVLVSGCGEDYIAQADTEVTVYLAPHVTGPQALPSQAPDAAFNVMLPSGTQVIIHKAYAALSTVELIPCPQVSILGQWPRKMSEWLLTSAIAHSNSTPTLSGTPYWLDLTLTQPQFMAVLYPPSKEYCELALSFSRADDDTVFSFEGNAENRQPVQELIGTTLIVEGQYRKSEQDSYMPFTIKSGKNLPLITLATESLTLSHTPVIMQNVVFDLSGWLTQTESHWQQGSVDQALLSFSDFWQR